jgi:glycine/D-amino acid oxidase-like deaminating enzyme
MGAMSVDVAILGGGVGGLWVLYELALRDYSCILIDEHDDLGRFASTRNQSWLHTGALYTVMGSYDERLRYCVKRMIQVCRQGTKIISEFCSKSDVALDAIEHTSECLFLFGSQDDIAHYSAESDLIIEGLDVQGLGKRDLQTREPILSSLKDDLLKYCLVTRDVPFDSYKILSALITETFTRNNVAFRPSGVNLTELEDISRHHDRWRIKNNSFGVVDARAVVCAAGALNPWLLNRVTERDDFGGMTIQKCLVAVLNQRICNRIIVNRNFESNLLNLVPFVGGTTINLGLLDEESDSFTDTDSTRAFRSDTLQTLSKKLNDFVPGLREMPGCEVHFYVCQKLNNTKQSNYPPQIHGNRHYFWVEKRAKAPNFFFFYPGKFTLAPVAAKELADRLSKILVRPINHELFKGPTPFVTPPPYFDLPTHTIQISNSDMLEFRPIDR